jgi:hypothetical protein
MFISVYFSSEEIKNIRARPQINGRKGGPSIKYIEWTGHQQQSAVRLQALWLPLKGSARRTRWTPEVTPS